VDGTQSSQPPSATFSPDGRWVAYSSAAPGVGAGSLLVQPFPTTGATYRISKDTGFHPRWSPDGKELFYTAGPGQDVAVSVATRPSFTFGSPVRLAAAVGGRAQRFETSYDITRDGKQFLAVVAAGQSATAPGAAPAPQIQVVLNWFSELQQLVPTR
jgi:WD40 repeat protein